MTLPTQMRAKALAQQTLTADAVWRQLHQAASDPYRRTGMFGWQFARGKLARDPVFRAVLQRGLIRPRAQVLDIGCGQGLLAKAPTFGRSLAQWQARLVACGFAVSTQAMSQGTPFANVLLVCDKLVGNKPGAPA